MVTKSMVQNYHPTHFADAVEHFSAVGNTWLSTSMAQHAEAHGLDWQGLAGTAYRLVADSDHAVITSAAEHALAASTVAAADGGQVFSALSSAKFAIEDAEAAGFDVDEDFRVTDRMQTYASPAQRAERQLQANSHAQNIAVAVGELQAADAAAASRAPDFSLYHQGINGHVQALDNGVATPAPPVPPTVKWPHVDQPPAIINNHGGQVPLEPNPKDHNCSTREIVDGIGKVLVGAGGDTAAVIAAPPSSGASLAGLAPGSLAIYDGLDDLSHCNNMGTIPGAPPVAGQDGPG
jgi:hypothetical protein